MAGTKIEHGPSTVRTFILSAASFVDDRNGSKWTLRQWALDFVMDNFLEHPWPCGGTG